MIPTISIDLTREIAANAGHVVDMDAFSNTEQRERARKSANRDAWVTLSHLGCTSDRL